MKFGAFVFSFVFPFYVWAQAQTLQHLVVFKENNSRQFQSLTGLNLQKYLKKQTNNHLHQFSQDLSSLRNGRQSPMSPLWILGSVIVDLSSDQISEVRRFSNVRAVIPLNRVVRLIEPVDSLEPVNTAQFTYGLIKIGIPEVRREFASMNGLGVRVGIIDTGINPNHSDLKGKVVAFKDFIKPQNLIPRDDHGHGTHVAGTVAGGSSSGRSIGVAPSADLVIAKVFDSAGSSDDANLLLALQWMTDPDGNSDTADAVTAVNNSWGTQTNTENLDPNQDPFCVVLNRMRAMNVLPVFSAGNSGPRSKTIGIPGACPESFTVGATNSRDSVASFSSRGPVVWKTGTLMKPDISAPGEDVYSSDKNGRYSTKSGTSMASPHVTGAVALLKQARPGLTAQQLQELLMKSSQDLGAQGMDPNFGQGRMDVLQSIKLIFN